jgi:asparagine synthase (glutamine-hydrolysing)
MYPTFKVSEMARKFVTVSLSGDGGDELFGGYGHYINYKRLDKLDRSPRSLKIAGRGMFDTMYKITKNRYALKFLQDFDILNNKENHIATPTGNNIILLSKYAEKISGNFVESSMKFDLNHTLTDCYLVKVDRASMANSLEVRCPFLDYRIVDLSQKIPIDYKTSLRNTKLIFRRAIADRVPKSIVDRKKKMGFTPPILEWILDSSKSMVQEKLEDLRNSNIVNRYIVEKSLNKLRSNSSSNAQDIFNLFSLQVWRERWIE